MPKEQHVAHVAHGKLLAAKVGPTELGRVAGASKQLARKWLEGAVPGERFRPAIESKYSIAPQDWQTRGGAGVSHGRTSTPPARVPISIAAPPVPSKLPKVRGETVGAQLTHIARLIAELQRGRKGAKLADAQRSIRYESQLIELRAKLLEERERGHERAELQAARLAEIAERRQQRAAAAREVRRQEVLNSQEFRDAEEELLQCFGHLPGAAEAIDKFEAERKALNSNGQ